MPLPSPSYGYPPLAYSGKTGNCAAWRRDRFPKRFGAASRLTSLDLFETKPSSTLQKNSIVCKSNCAISAVACAVRSKRCFSRIVFVFCSSGPTPINRFTHAFEHPSNLLCNCNTSIPCWSKSESITVLRLWCVNRSDSPTKFRVNRDRGCKHH